MGKIPGWMEHDIRERVHAAAVTGHPQPMIAEVYDVETGEAVAAGVVDDEEHLAELHAEAMRLTDGRVGWRLRNG